MPALATVTLQNVNDAVTIPASGLGSVDFSLTGSPVNATVTFEASSDGVTWYAVKAYPKGAAGNPGGSTATTAGSYGVSVGGTQFIRARLTAITSGSFTAIVSGTTSISRIVAKSDNAADLQVGAAFQGSGGTFAPVSPTNPLPITQSVGGAAVSATNPIPIYDAYQAPVIATWNSATALNTTQTVNTQGYDTVIITIAPTAPITAGAVSFEVYDGTNWIPIKAPRTDSYQTDVAFPLAGASLHSWQLPVAGYPQVRARLSTAITGTGSAQIISIASSAPDVSLVTVGIDPATLPLSTTLTSAFTPTAASGAGVAGAANTDYTILAANAARKFLLIQNTHATATLYINTAVAWNGTALVGITIAPGQSQKFDVAVPNSVIHAASATANTTYFILEG